MQFILNGFSQVTGFRIFEFERVDPDRTRTAFTVRIDVALIQRYGIRLQELPLLCRAVLEHDHADETTRAFTFTEEDMCRHAKHASELAAEVKRKRDRRPPPPDASSPRWPNTREVEQARPEPVVSGGQAVRRPPVDR